MRKLGLALLATGLMTGCFLMPKAKSGKKAGSGGGGALIQRDSIFMDRVNDGNQAELKFKTAKDSICQMAVYAQDAGGTPTRDSPAVTPCANQDKPRSAFDETVSGLKTDALYYVIVYAWEPGSDKDHGDQVTVRETPSTSAGTGANPDGPAGVYKDLFIARFDLPLKSAELHHTVLDAPADVTAIKTKLTRSIGCSQGVPPKDASFRTASKDLLLKSVATRDLAAGTAVPHPDYPERLQLTYGSLNDGVDKWTILYQLNGKDIQVPVRPISRILNMEMESTTVLNFDQPNLNEAADPLKIDVTKPLKLTWTTGSNLLDQSYMTVQIGRPDYEKQIYCVWQASKLSGQIEPQLLANLDDGAHVVLAELASNQVWVKDGWVITTYDWRSGRIEK